MFTDQQMQHLVNIVLACERWAKLEVMEDGLSELGYMNTESEYLHNRAMKYNAFMISEMVKLSGREETDSFFDDLYSHTQDINRFLDDLD